MSIPFHSNTPNTVSPPVLVDYPFFKLNRFHKHKRLNKINNSHCKLYFYHPIFNLPKQTEENNNADVKLQSLKPTITVSKQSHKLKSSKKNNGHSRK